MKAFLETTIVLSFTGLVLVILSAFSGWLSAAFLMIFAADILNIVVADDRRTQRRRALSCISILDA